MYVPRAMYSLSTSFCTVPESLRMSAPWRRATADIERQQNRGRGVDGHRGGNLGQFDAVEKALHVFDGIDGHADFSDFPDGQRMVGIQADLRGQIEGDGEPGGAVGQQIFVALVGFLGVAHAGVLAHGPEPSAVHGGLHAAGERIFAGIADFAVLVPDFRDRRECRGGGSECARQFRDRLVRHFRL